MHTCTVWVVDQAHSSPGSRSRTHVAGLLERFPWDKPVKDDAWGTMFVGSLTMFPKARCFDLVELRGEPAEVSSP